MFNRIVSFTERFAHGRTVLFLLLVLAVLAALLNASELPFSSGTLLKESGGLEIPDMRYSGYTSADVYQLFDAWGPVGRSHYRQMLVVDLFFPAVYGLFLAATLAWLARQIAWPKRLVRWSPLLGLVCLMDYGESAILWPVLLAYPTRYEILDGFVGLSSIFTALKFGWFLLALAVLIVFTIILFVQRTGVIHFKSQTKAQ